LDHCPTHPSADVVKLKDGKIKAMFLIKNTTALIPPIQGILQVCKANYCSEVLLVVANTVLQVREFLKTFTLKGVKLAWR
jgi:hypothetical protein